MNENEFEKLLINYLNQRGTATSEELRDKFVSSRKNVKDSLSQAHFYRHLKSLTGKSIIELTKEDRKNFGISDKDGRKAYYTTKEKAQVKLHLQTVFHTVVSTSGELQKAALNEIELYKEYQLSPSELDSLVPFISTKDPEIAEPVLRILYKHLAEYNRVPLNKELFIEQLKKALQVHGTINPPHRNLRTMIIFFLGHYDQETVLDQLEKDLRSGIDTDHIKNDYWHRYTAKIIDEQKARLFKLRVDLQQEGKRKEALFLQEIRNRAHRFLNPKDHPEDDGKTLKEIITGKREGPL